MLISDHTLILVQLLPLLFLIFNNHCNFYIAAIPQRANEPWSVILCKFADTAGYEPQAQDWYQEWMTGSGTGIYLFTEHKIISNRMTKA